MCTLIYKTYYPFVRNGPLATCSFDLFYSFVRQLSFIRPFFCPYLMRPLNVRSIVFRSIRLLFNPLSYSVSYHFIMIRDRISIFCLLSFHFTFPYFVRCPSITHQFSVLCLSTLPCAIRHHFFMICLVWRRPCVVTARSSFV